MGDIPVWVGCRPYDQIPVQFNCHVQKEEGRRTEANRMEEQLFSERSDTRKSGQKWTQGFGWELILIPSVFHSENMTFV